MTEDTEDAKHLVIEGDLTIRNSEAIHQVLSTGLNQRRSLVIECSDANEIDLTFIQLLIAARKSALAAGKSLTLGGPLPELLRTTLHRAGLTPIAESPTPIANAWWFAGSGE